MLIKAVIMEKFIKDRLDLLEQLKDELYSELHRLEYYSGKRATDGWELTKAIYKLAKEALEAQLNNK